MKRTEQDIEANRVWWNSLGKNWKKNLLPKMNYRIEFSDDEIQAFIDTRELTIDKNYPVTSFSLLSKLHKLEKLVLKWNCNIRNQNELLTALSRLSELKELDLSHTNLVLENLDFLMPLKNLQRLHLDSTVVYRINGIESLGNLKILTLGGKCFSNDLDYEETKILTDLNLITVLKSLDRLRITGVSHADDYSFLKSLETLTFLYLTKSPVSNLDALHYCKNLKELTLVDNKKLKNLDSISNLKHITDLKLSSNEKLLDFSFLEKMTALKTINISDQSIDLSVLSGLENLKLISFGCMDLNNNLSPLLNLPSLKNILVGSFVKGLSKNTINAFKKQRPDVEIGQL